MNYFFDENDLNGAETFAEFINKGEINSFFLRLLFFLYLYCLILFLFLSFDYLPKGTFCILFYFFPLICIGNKIGGSFYAKLSDIRSMMLILHFSMTRKFHSFCIISNVFVQTVLSMTFNMIFNYKFHDI